MNSNNAAQQAQDAVEQFWNQKPCDSDMSSKDTSLIEYYNEIETDRYKYQNHINTIMNWIDWSNKRVLEIGTGVGTDARNIIRRGGIYLGINVDQGSVDATQKALNAFNLSGTVKKCSATHLFLENESIDIVYSFGVLHHIPDAQLAVSEIYRALKPGGELLIMVYNKRSINYKIEIMILRKLFLRLLALPGMIDFLGSIGFPKEKLVRHREIFSLNKNMSNEEWLSRNTDGPDNPYSLVYDKNEIESLLPQFTIKRNEVFYFDVRHYGKLGNLFPKWLVNFISTHYGWHRVVHAIKP